MLENSLLEPVDYLLIGHVTQDITPQGPVLGGTVSYAALTARALGMRVGVITSCRSDLDLSIFNGITTVRKNAAENSTFINEQTPNGRVQHILGIAETLTLADIPAAWQNTPIVHLGPILHEISSEIASSFSKSILCITPQGCMRSWNSDGLISYQPWQNASKILDHTLIAVMSIEDVHGDEDIVTDFAAQLPILVVTEGAAGARVYWNGDIRTFRPPMVNEVDPVGAGDIFATSFFVRYKATRDPWESARFATLLAANSVTRKSLNGVPTSDEVSQFNTEIIEYKTL